MRTFAAMALTNSVSSTVAIAAPPETGASAEEARHFADSVNAAAGSSLVSMDDIAASATKIRVLIVCLANSISSTWK